MKKLMMIAAMMLMSVGAFAQDGKFAVGVDFNYLIDSDASRMAPGVKLQYEFIEDFRAEVNFKYYPKKYSVSNWNVNANIQYVIPVTDMFRVYPLVTFGVLGSSPEYGEGSSAFVFGGGAGAEYFLTENVKVYLDAIYQYGKKDGFKVVNNPLLSLGIAYAF
jgi:outer membrane protein X